MAKEEEEILKVKLPEEGEIFGIVEQKLGGNKLYVRCEDEIVRLCRIPGRFRKRMWIKEGDVVLIKPWDFQNDRGDIVYRYTKPEVAWLMKRGYLKKLEDDLIF